MNTQTPDQSTARHADAIKPATSETTAFLLAAFADLYRLEIAAEEDVHRTLPFFGTALGLDHQAPVSGVTWAEAARRECLK